MEKDLKNLMLPGLEQITAVLGQKPFLARYIFTFIHQKDSVSLDQITPLSKTFRAALRDAGYFISALRTVQTLEDADGTIKFVFELSDGCRIESVRLLDDQRNTFCVSTQVGCRMGCLFCATGRLKYRRNMTAAEIAGQIYQMEQQCGKVRNLVYMGMGEPLDNYEQTMRSVEILNHPDGRRIGIRHITISTCGLPDKILRLAEESLQPRLAVSLHGPDDATRNTIMQISHKYSIKDLFAALRQYQRKTGRRITIEYCLMRSVNDSPQQARQLARLVQDLKCNVNLIEFNAFEGCDFEPATPAAVKHFAAILERQGVETVIRFKRGRSIRAACGQLGAG